ncbi:MAG: serine/threonine protein kinase [Pseudomonadales bacterium]|nr:serine/threonine protein kinase [Pseudomonadales bacterium]
MPNQSPNQVLTDTDNSAQHFANLSPDTVIDAVESLCGFSDGRLLALNSYENRVYQVGMENAEPLVVKFYRPQRWSDADILEEHHYCFELAEQDIPVVLPSVIQGNTLHHWESHRFAIFPRRGGRAPEFENLDNLFILGQTLGKMHQVGKATQFHHRPALNLQSFGIDAIQTVSESLLPAEYHDNYLTIAEQLIDQMQQNLCLAADTTFIRCHGDCHAGNILWRNDAPHFVDFDDARMAPAVQDIWMMLSGDKFQQQTQFLEILEGYEMFTEFDRRELHWIEPLRTLRMMNYCAWLAKRWQDPAFPMHFPWFNTARYWGEHIVELREQLLQLQDNMYADKFLSLN